MFHNLFSFLESNGRFSVNYRKSLHVKSKHYPYGASVHYLECADSSIANNGATFLGKSAKGNTGCVQSRTAAVKVARPPWVEQLDWADEILNSRENHRNISKNQLC